MAGLLAGPAFFYPATNQKAFGNPACFKAALAVCLDLMLASTVKLMPVIGLYQIS